jgi:hypothetical protein
LVLIVLFVATHTALHAAELHVATGGNDTNPGTKSAPLRTIQHAADLAKPGDTVTVHAGVYREYIDPPRGGDSEARRIVYRAASGEKVEIKGSEAVKSWVQVQGDVWKAALPNSFFGAFNPYIDLIHGDWFNPLGRPHHTGAVYLNGEWLTEAVKLEEVMAPEGVTPAWLHQGGSQFLLNVAWLRPAGGTETARIPAPAFAAKHGTTNAPSSEGGECVGWIAAGDWVRYEKVDFKQGAEQVEIRAASAADGGVIELRLDSPDGELLGACDVENTGGWQSWITYKTKIKPVSGIKTLCLAFKGRLRDAVNPQLWFAQVDGANTTIWARFKGVNPNEQQVEVNVRRTVFYPSKPGRNFITVRGFILRHAATPWAPPTAEQVGLIGTHWSRGWIIENNTVSHSICSGIALGKHGDQWDNTSADTAEGYVKTIERATAQGWNKATIGHHIVRNNTVSHCEQAGIVGSLGAAFSTVTGNTIHNIHVRRLFTGAEMAGIKFHAAIDTVISNNHIYRTCLGLWLDWMAQGTRVSGNLFHDNAGQDMFVEVDHGPFVADNNLFLSRTSLLDMSEGGAYAHNLFAGKIITNPEPNRETPYHPAHSTTVAGLTTIKGGDDRFYNNILIGSGAPKDSPAKAKDPQWEGGYGLWMYDFREFPLQAGGNVYYNGARPCALETNAVVLATEDPKVKITQKDGRFLLSFTTGPELNQAVAPLVTTALLGKARVPGLPYENADGAPIKIASDYFGKKRNEANPKPGPFEYPLTSLKVWPRP